MRRHREGILRQLVVIAAFSAVMLLAPNVAHATNMDCQLAKRDLGPIYNTLQMRLRAHLYTRDNNLKITAEQDVQAYFAFAKLAGRYDDLMDDAIRAFNDNDPKAKRLCYGYVLQANCEAYQVYQDIVMTLPGMRHASILAEGERRCAEARNY